MQRACDTNGPVMLEQGTKVFSYYTVFVRRFWYVCYKTYWSTSLGRASVTRPNQTLLLIINTSVKEVLTRNQ